MIFTCPSQQGKRFLRELELTTGLRTDPTDPTPIGGTHKTQLSCGAISDTKMGSRMKPGLRELGLCTLRPVYLG